MPSAQSVQNSEPSAVTSRTMVAIAYVIVPVGSHEVSTSELALDSSWPVGCDWCQDSGSSR
jgi:hypothetical protein